MWIEALALRRAAPQLCVRRTGVGPARSRRAAERLRKEPFAALAVAGLCGALDDGLAPGDLFVATELRAGEGTRVGVAWEALVASLASAGLPAVSGPLVSSDHPVRGAERHQLARSSARVVDMESAWLAESAAGRPFAVLRVVMDSPKHEVWRPSSLAHLLRALRTLRRAAPAIAAWARAAREIEEGAAHPRAG
jgi:4-hydroxy-3-methylbut-2-enyl diphosphate reductase